VAVHRLQLNLLNTDTVTVTSVMNVCIVEVSCVMKSRRVKQGQTALLEKIFLSCFGCGPKVLTNISLVDTN